MTQPGERDRLIASHQAASEAFDRALLALSSGSLAVSIAFVRDIAPKPVERWMLEVSWILMGAALVGVMLSFLLSTRIHERMLDCLEQGTPWDDEPWWLRSGVTYLNRIAGIAFVTGAAFLIAFAMKNF